jgi:hypothetical protein
MQNDRFTRPYGLGGKGRHRGSSLIMVKDGAEIILNRVPYEGMKLFWL